MIRFLVHVRKIAQIRKNPDEPVPQKYRKILPESELLPETAVSRHSCHAMTILGTNRRGMALRDLPIAIHPRLANLHFVLVPLQSRNSEKYLLSGNADEI